MVRLYAELVLEIMTFGYRSVNSVSTASAIVRVEQANDQPWRRSWASQAAAMMTMNVPISTGLGQKPLPAVTWVQTTQPMTIRATAGPDRAATRAARSATSPVVLSVMKVAPCRMQIATRV